MAKFSSVTSRDLEHFQSILGLGGVVTEEKELNEANCDWTGNFIGKSHVLLIPGSSSQTSEVLRYCYERQLAVVPQGGNTGLVGGSVPVYEEVILNLSRLKTIISFDEVSGAVVCEAGCTLGTLNQFLAKYSFMVPLDLGPKDKCQIGGNVSTNAGGLRYIRYGSLHGSILGLEVVLSDGTVLDMLRTLRKDNTGYDLKQVFIGAEGTLGVVTKVSFLAVPKPSSVQLAFVACKDFERVKRTFLLGRRQLGEILSAVELLDSVALNSALKHLEHTTHPLPNCTAPFFLLLETSGSSKRHDREKLDGFLESAREQNLILESAVSESEAQSALFWRIREGMATAVKRMGEKVFKYDLSLPVDKFYALVEVMRERLRGDAAEVVAWGHFGDGNLHLNVVALSCPEKILEKVEPFVYQWTAESGGSVSAEHGLGAMKPRAIHYSQKPGTVDMMRKLKAMLDPRGILNPYKVLPPDDTAGN